MTLVLEDKEHKNVLEEKLEKILEQLIIATELLKVIAAMEERTDEDILNDHNP